MGAQRSGNQAVFSKSRIKQILFNDEEVGKISATVAVIISRATELFLEDLVKQALQTHQEEISESVQNTNKVITTTNLKSVVNREARFDFLKDLICKFKKENVVEVSSTLRRVTKSNKSALDPSSPSASNSTHSPKKRTRNTNKKVKEEKDVNNDDDSDELNTNVTISSASHSTTPIKKQKGDYKNESISPVAFSPSVSSSISKNISSPLSHPKSIKIQDILNSTMPGIPSTSINSSVTQVESASQLTTSPTEIYKNSMKSAVTPISTIERLTTESDDEEFD